MADEPQGGDLIFLAGKPNGRIRVYSPEGRELVRIEGNGRLTAFTGSEPTGGGPVTMLCCVHGLRLHQPCEKCIEEAPAPGKPGEDLGTRIRNIEQRLAALE